MQMILKKRILRDFKENLPRYLALGLMVILGMYIVISLVAAADTIIKGSAKAAKAHKKQERQKKAKPSEQTLDTSQLLKKKDDRNV